MKNFDNLSEIKKNPHIKDDNGDALNRQLETYFQYIERINSIQKHTQIANMDEIVVSNKDGFIIGTQALATCFGILLYDRKNKYGICGHAAPDNILGITIDMLKHISLDTEATFEYAIIPGYRTAEPQKSKNVELIAHTLKSYSTLNPKIKFTYLRTQLNPTTPADLMCYDFAFDTENGIDVSSIAFFDYTQEQKRRKI